MSNVLIVGGGRIGGYVASLLREGDDDVRVIEVDARRAARLGSELAADVVVGSGTDPDVLETAGARRTDSIVALTERDETNLVVTSLARFEFAVPRTIARVNNPANAWLYTAVMGVDVALNQADIIGHLVTEEMSLGEMTTLLKLRRGSYALVEEQVHPMWAAARRPVAELSLPAECILVGVLREEEVVVPHGDTVLLPGDEVLAIVRTDAARGLADVLGAR